MRNRASLVMKSRAPVANALTAWTASGNLSVGAGARNAQARE
jgi:hypothetical protein